MKVSHFTPMFVENVPASVQEGVLYISMEYATAIHRCACGCGIEVVTPITPTDWKLTYDGSVSLHPSIGNWSFPCRSHYWIRNNRVRWAESWTDEEVQRNREVDALRKQEHYAQIAPKGNLTDRHTQRDTLWTRIKGWFYR